MLDDIRFDTPFTKSVIVYVVDEVSVKGAKMNFDGSREVDGKNIRFCELDNTVQSYSRPRVVINPSQPVKKAFDAKDKEAAFVVWITGGPRINAIGTTLFNTATVFAPWPQAVKQLHRVTMIVYENPFISIWRGIAVGGLNVYRRFKKSSTAVALGAGLLTVKKIPCQGLPPAPVDIDKSNINESQ